MALTINILYKGEKGNAKRFAEEMIASGIVADIRKEEGNLQYDYFLPIDNNDTLLLIDVWTNQEALDRHHASPMMSKIIALRKKYNLSMTVKRFTDTSPVPETDQRFIKS